MLSRTINNNGSIKGLSLNGFENKQTLFADDASFAIVGSEQTFTELIKTLDKICANIWSKIKQRKMCSTKNWIFEK